ncbi:MAG TPA: bifunctional DNA primase/polymerase [Gemmatimonadaceae bacterium]
MNAERALSKLGAAALRYAEHGWHVFPLRPRDKKPLLGGGAGFLAATADLAQVRAWWTEHPNANVGLWPGQSGLAVVDLDGPVGAQNAIALGLFSQPTLACVTGREDGGRHLYFRRPDFALSNCDIGDKIDVRCDGGYVVLPPSVHPSGAVYRWEGAFEDLSDIPPIALAAMRAAQGRIDRGESQVTGAPRREARDVAFQEAIDEGGRNNALTRYAGRLLAKGLAEDETLQLVAAVNTAHCKPPLPQSEVNALVANIATREIRKRTTATGTTLALVDEPEALPAFSDMAAEQIARARSLLDRDVRLAPRWAWSDLDRLVGAMMPGDLLVVGSLMGNGKSTILMSQMDAFAKAAIPTLYVPLEVDPAICRLRWAAWKLELDVKHAIRQEWERLPEGAREMIDCTLAEQEQNAYVNFVADKRLTLGGVVAWCRRAKDDYGARVVMLDHLHRLDYGLDAASRRVNVTEVVRRLKDAARELGIVLIAAAQLNRSSDPIDAYTAPVLARLKESAGIAEEADVVLMLSRRLKGELPDKWQSRLHAGSISELDLAEPGTMVVTCRKHRLDDSALNRAVLLSVENGKLRQRAPSWRIHD